MLDTAAAHRAPRATCVHPFDPGYPRDLAGYGEHPPHPRWPGGARIALQFVLNYEEGAEMSVLHGDAASETFLSEIVGAQAFPARHMSMESLYEYGSRAGVWRLLRLFRERQVPVTVFGVAMALLRHPRVVEAFLRDGHEIASHGFRWVSYQHADAAAERDHVARAVEAIRALTGRVPEGWYTGRDSPNTRRLVVEHGGFVYDADSYADDLPYWVEVDCARGRVPHLVVPYALDTNDMRFATPQGFNSGDQFFAYLRDAFDALYAEGDPAAADAPKMLSIGLHCRLAGRPARIAALARFLDHVRAHDGVWCARRIDIARHWIATHPFVPGARA
jgi:putative urate catabolism protein